jgi:methylenetetrahydrofolate dehydrogenase (NADP+)/methenyltetrahydrofolate cyclohydrolase
MNTVIDGNAISAKIRQELAADIEAMKKRNGVVPGLAVVLVGDNPASLTYVRNKNRAAHKIGIHSEQHTLPSTAQLSDVLEILSKLNSDPSIHGILVQLPLPKHIDGNAVLNAIDPDKDADGLSSINLGRLVSGEALLKPCTPFGILKLLSYTGIRTEGMHVVVVGRSILVGKPISVMLAEKGLDATVTLCHSKTRDLASVTRQADILIAAIGRPEFITADMVKTGAVVIDVGINRVKDASLPKGYRIVGDVKYDEVAPKCSAITPTPGGVGPMTVTMLLYNTVLSARAHAIVK